MQPFASAPRTLVALLAAVVLLLFLLLLPSVKGLLWPALVLALSLKALFGSKRALNILKAFFYLTSVALLLLVVARPFSGAADFLVALSAVLHIVTARYIATSKEVARFYATLPKSTSGEG